MLETEGVLPLEGVALKHKTNVTLEEKKEAMGAVLAGSWLNEDRVPQNPIRLFVEWFDVARVLCEEPNVMCLSTTSSTGEPRGRHVLLKRLDETHFCWYTNYSSVKAESLTANPVASLSFYWQPLQRQVLIYGGVEKDEEHISDRLFEALPREDWGMGKRAKLNNRKSSGAES